MPTSRPPEASVRNLDAQIALQQPLIEQGTADVASAEATLQFAQEEQARYDGLMKSGSGTIQRAQQTDAALREKTAQLQRGKVGSFGCATEGRRAHHRTRTGGGATRARPARSNSRRRSTFPTRGFRRRLTARSARGRCGSGSSCRPERS